MYKRDFLTIELDLGRYLVTWRLRFYPLKACLPYRRLPFGIGLNVFKENPAEEDTRRIADARRHLRDNPNDAMTRFTLGNMLRMNGQVGEARQEYQIVAGAGDKNYSEQAKVILGKLTETPDHEGRRSFHVVFMRRYGTI